MPSQAPGSGQGAGYEFQDTDVVAGETYWYWLEDVDLGGVASMHGPVSVVFTVPTAVTLSGLEASSRTSRRSSAWPWLLLLAAAALAVGSRASR